MFHYHDYDRVKFERQLSWDTMSNNFAFIIIDNFDLQIWQPYLADVVDLGFVFYIS